MADSAKWQFHTDLAEYNLTCAWKLVHKLDTKVYKFPMNQVRDMNRIGQYAKEYETQMRLAQGSLRSVAHKTG